jgi:hypothetical protein
MGLRSTRIRTPDRTAISVPNSQFSSMALENISGRDKISFNPILNLRRDTTSDQLLKVLSSVSEILKNDARVETGALPVFGQAMRWTLAGIGLGTGGALVGARALRNLLYEIRPHDPLTLAIVAVPFSLIAMAACYLPARQASRLDPVITLRHE